MSDDVVATGWLGPSERGFCFHFFVFPLCEVVRSTGRVGTARKKVIQLMVM